MTPDFWHDRWESNRIGFHEAEANRLLVGHFDQLALAPGARVFLPLCGKTRDIGWLLAQGMKVVGAELSLLALEQLFADLGLEPEVINVGGLTRMQAGDVVMYGGDIFDLSATLLGPVDAIYDRAALVALPVEMRARYSRHLMEITGCAPQLLVSFDYDPERMQGPPFSVTSAEIAMFYGQDYDVTEVLRTPATDRMKERCDAIETVYLLR